MKVKKNYMRPVVRLISLEPASFITTSTGTTDVFSKKGSFSDFEDEESTNNENAGMWERNPKGEFPWE